MTTIKTISYRDVLHTRTHIGHYSEMCKLAIALGYPYFLWNDQIYEVIGDSFVETEMTIKNIQEPVKK